jgi:glycosyltransferase involved in cell wall biosynthesis
MRIALLAPLPPEQNGIADYAGHLKHALEALGVQVVTPLQGVGNDPRQAVERVAAVDWSGVDLVHAELGGGRLAEFQALQALRRRWPGLPLTATVHDPERLVWRRERLPWPLSMAARMPSPAPQIATVLADPLCLREERQLARHMTRLITLTQAGSQALRERMGLQQSQMVVINHGNLPIEPVPLPPLKPLRLLYFGFIYRGKGIEDLLEALAALFVIRPDLRSRVRLTLAGGSEPEMAFGPSGSYLEQLRRRIREQGLVDLIDWQLDLPAERIAEIIQTHHVMVLPYRESSKLKLLGTLRGTSGALSWAVACGRGVITSDARSFAEEVSHGNGMIYPQGNVQALTEALGHICAHPEQAASWAQKASEMGRARVWSQTAERFREVFQHACEVKRCSIK